MELFLTKKQIDYAIKYNKDDKTSFLEYNNNVLPFKDKEFDFLRNRKDQKKLINKGEKPEKLKLKVTNTEKKKDQITKKSDDGKIDIKSKDKTFSYKRKSTKIVHLCRKIDECDINLISKKIYDLGKEKSYPDITNSNKFNIAIVGLGNIGINLYKHLTQNKISIQKKTNVHFNIKYVSAKNILKKRQIKNPKNKWIKNYLIAAKHKEIDIVIELIGGSEGAAKKLVFNAIKKNAVSEGSKLRQDIDKKVDKKTSVINRFIDVFELWKVGGALEIKEIKKTNEVYHFDVTRCKYAEMYDKMGIKDLGKLLSCNRDYNFSIGFDKNLKLERNKTIMEGHKCCTFRYQSLKRI